ncbi:MAG: FtsQ-type POTRA domain-containing protein [Gammaproteobacteria bacterium]|nr:FtsQ-type POTRA domain-containing protein [Gammaproteobacteria bacterium]
MVQARKKSPKKSTPSLVARLGACMHVFKYIVEASVAIAVVLVVTWGGYRIIDQSIKTVNVDAPWQRVTRMQIDEVITRPIIDGFLSTDMRLLQEQLAAVPWVDRVRIERYWPAQLNIVLTEQVAMARWQDDGLLNVRGELFLSEERHIGEELPRLAGPEGSEWQVAQRYQALNAAMNQVGWSLRTLQLDDRGAWTAGMNNGIEVWVGVDEVDRRLKRFRDVVVPALRQEEALIEKIDLRYTNGFSVAYKSNTNKVDSIQEPLINGGGRHA